MLEPRVARYLEKLRFLTKRYPRSQSRWRELPVVLDDDRLLIGGWQVMRSWEAPLMEALAREVTCNGGDILEVGFGMAISATAIMSAGCSSYTVIEAHPEVADRAREWGRKQDVPVTVLEGFWQDIEPELDRRYDGILFDTYPLSRGERHKNHYPFIPRAPRLLRQNGVLTLYSDETSRFRQEHLELLLGHFDEVKLVKVSNLQPPADCEYWRDSTMVIPVACNRCGDADGTSDQAGTQASGVYAAIDAATRREDLLQSSAPNGRVVDDADVVAKARDRFGNVGINGG